MYNLFTKKEHAEVAPAMVSSSADFLTSEKAILKIVDNNRLVLSTKEDNRILWEYPERRWNYRGCYNDDDARTIPGGFVRVNKYNINNIGNTHNECRNIAISKNHDMYAIQDKNACFTGPKDTQYYKLGRADRCKNAIGASYANDVFVFS